LGKQDVKAGRMKKQLGQWLIEDRTKDKDFTYRLTDKDSRLILHGFMYLVEAIRGDSNEPKLLMKLLAIVYIDIKLRDCAAIFSMYHLTEENLAKLHQLSHDISLLNKKSELVTKCRHKNKFFATTNQNRRRSNRS